MKSTYRAIRLQQTRADKPVAPFAAAADEIALWSGIPQKKRFGTGEETAGFQREQNPARVKSLRDFYRNDENIIQNPLLCATMSIEGSSASFEPSAGDGDVETGTIEIEIPDFSSMPFVDILARVRGSLELRIPDLAGRAPSAELVSSLKERAALGTPDGSADEPEGEPSDEGEAAAPEAEGDPSSALFEESHIADFWQEVAARHEVLKAAPQLGDGDELLG